MIRRVVVLQLASGANAQWGWRCEDARKAAILRMLCALGYDEEIDYYCWVGFSLHKPYPYCLYRFSDSSILGT